MQPGQSIHTTAGTICKMTPEQFLALQSMCQEGKWDHVNGDVMVVGNEPLGVMLPDLMYIGIERDGYIHS